MQTEIITIQENLIKIGSVIQVWGKSKFACHQTAQQEPYWANPSWSDIVAWQIDTKFVKLTINVSDKATQVTNERWCKEWMANCIELAHNSLQVAGDILNKLWLGGVGATKIMKPRHLLVELCDKYIKNVILDWNQLANWVSYLKWVRWPWVCCAKFTVRRVHW